MYAGPHEFGTHRFIQALHRYTVSFQSFSLIIFFTNTNLKEMLFHGDEMKNFLGLGGGGWWKCGECSTKTQNFRWKTKLLV